MVGFSTILCQNDNVFFNQLSLLFQLAYQSTEIGFTCCIITKKIHSFKDLLKPPYNEYPEKLERIYFRYFNTYTDIINWCHKLHEVTLKPNVLLLNGLENFCEPYGLEAVELSAALIDANNYCNQISKLKKSYLFVNAIMDISKCLPYMLSLFNRVLSLENSTECTIAKQLYPNVINHHSFDLFCNNNLGLNSFNNLFCVGS